MFDSLVESIAHMFGALPNKDVFLAFCQNNLARRLLSSSPLDDLESAFIVQFKKVHGVGFTYRMECMLADRVLSLEYAEKFQEWSSASLKQKSTPPSSSTNTSSSTFSFSCQVLRSGCWPVFDPSTLVLPTNVSDAMAYFTQFYTSCVKARTRLTFQQALGQVVMRVFFGKGEKEVTMTPEQASICLLFNEADH